MPYYVVQKTLEALNERGKSIRNARILVLGLAYKKDVDDARESPSFVIIELLMERGAIVDYNDPYVKLPLYTRRHKLEKESIELTPENLSSYDCVIILTDHSIYNPDFILKHAELIIDTRNLIKDARKYPEKVVRA